MTNEELKLYTSRAKELEVAVYTQKRLMDLHNNLIKTQLPIKPTKKEFALELPVEPREEEYVYQHKYLNCLSIGVVCLLGAFIFLIGCVICATYAGIIVVLVLGGLGIFSLKDAVETISLNKEIRTTGPLKYKEAKEKYRILKDEHMEKVRREEKRYEDSYKEYEIKCSNHNKYEFTMKEKYRELLGQLENALEEHYNRNIVFSKYRNIVAITAINEYLESGRCYSLDGPDGAYNLYEMELRQNIVIDKLTKIIDNLEDIRHNQFSLYEELKKSNEKVDDIILELVELKLDTKLNTYIDYITAKYIC